MEMTPGLVMQAFTLVFVVLAFAFGRGDKSAGKVDELRKECDELKDKQHEQALAMKDMEARLRDHVGGGYATKADIASLKDEIASFKAIFEPIAQQLGFHSVRRG
jgi:TolA-binding protein